MIRPLIITPRPGPEVFMCGGFLAHLQNKFEYDKNDVIGRNRPRVMYGLVSDYFNPFIRKSDGHVSKKNGQLADIRRASELLGFTWEVLFNKQSSFFEFDLVEKKLKERIEFYKPDIILIYDPDDFTPMDFASKGFSSLRMLCGSYRGEKLTFGISDGNLLLRLNSNDANLAKKAAMNYRSFFGDNVGLLSSITKEVFITGKTFDGSFYKNKDVFSFGQVLNVESISSISLKLLSEHF